MSATPPGPPPIPGIDLGAVRALTEEVAAMATRAREAGRRMEQVSVEVTSRDRSVVVTVGSGGVLRGVRPGPAARSTDPTHLCAAVLEAYGRAARQAATEASEIMAGAVGRDTVAMQHLRAALPPDPDEAP